VPRGRHPRHRAVQPGEDGLRRLLGPAAEGTDRHPSRDGRGLRRSAAMTIVDGLATQAWLDRDEAAPAGGLSRVTDIVAVEGRGSWLIDVDGRRWLDFASGIAVTNIGHCHPRVIEAAE